MVWEVRSHHHQQIPTSSSRRHYHNHHRHYPHHQSQLSPWDTKILFHDIFTPERHGFQEIYTLSCVSVCFLKVDHQCLNTSKVKNVVLNTQFLLLPGTDKQGYGFGGTGKKSFGRQFDSYGEVQNKSD